MLTSSIAIMSSKVRLIFRRKKKDVKNKKVKNREIEIENEDDNKKKSKMLIYGKPPAAAITPPTPKVSLFCF